MTTRTRYPANPTVVGSRQYGPRLGGPVLFAHGSVIEVYVDADASQSADVADLDGALIASVTVEGAAFPGFYGPPGYSGPLWGRVAGSQGTFRIDPVPGGVVSYDDLDDLPVIPSTPGQVGADPAGAAALAGAAARAYADAQVANVTTLLSAMIQAAETADDAETAGILAAIQALHDTPPDVTQAELDAEAAARAAGDTSTLNAAKADATTKANAARDAAITAAAADVGQRIATHITAADPHGDRAFTTQQISAALTAFVGMAPAALDTWAELVSSIQADQSGLAALQSAVNGRLEKAQNLADLPDKTAARANLGLGSAAVRPASDFAPVAAGAAGGVSVDPSGLIVVKGANVQSALAQLDAQSALAGKAASPYRPGVGTWWTPYGHTLTTRAIGQGTSYWQPFMVPRAFTASIMRFEIAAAGVAGAQLRTALYDSDPATGLPLNLLIDFGLSDGSAIALIDLSLNITIPAGQLWVVQVGGGAGAAGAVRRMSVQMITLPLPTPANGGNAGGIANASPACLSKAGAAAGTPFPAQAPATWNNPSNIELPKLQFLVSA